MNLQEVNEIKTIIINAQEPILFKNKLTWDMLKWTLDDWKTILKNEQLQFRCGKNGFTKQPQWERTTKDKKANFKEFLLSTQTKSDTWMYFDYKYLKEWFKNVDKLKQSINWSSFGFPNLSFEDSTIWIGSEGAHTPCHIDTYGCNLVAQIYGRKQWILCPPDENLKPTRIPYEESSIYSELNFFSPNLQDFVGVENCRRIILEPGDVLLVPHHWWHYVENLEVAISVNVWIPLQEDDEERLKESLVQLFINQITKGLDDELKNIILNPNSDEVIGNVTLNASMELVTRCKEVLKISKRSATTKRENFNLEDCLKKYLLLHKIPKMTNNELMAFLKMQGDRFISKADYGVQNNVEEIFKIINAFTNNEVIELVKDKMLH